MYSMTKYSMIKTLKHTVSMLVLASLALALFVTNVTSVSADAPEIKSFNIVQSSFDSTTRRAQIDFSLNTRGKIGLEIQDGNNPVKTLAIRQDVSAGSYTYYWDGTNDNGKQVANGTYKAQLLFYGDKFTLFADDNITVNLGGGTNPLSSVIMNDYAYPATFDPRNENVKIYFTLREAVEDLTVRIEKNGVEIVTLLSSQSKAPGTYSVQWNSRDKHNVIVREGEYRYVITAKGDTEAGSIMASYGVVTGVAPDITNNSVVPSTFNPKTESTYVNYSLNIGSYVDVEIYNGTVLVDTLTSNANQASGTHSVRWDGRNSNGRVVQNGTYTYVVKAENPWGNDTKSGTVIVKYDVPNPMISPDITNAYASPEKFNPNRSELTNIKYTINTCAYITAKVYRKSNNSYIKTLKEVDYTCAGTYSVKWDGRDSHGVVVANGDYTIRIKADNSKGSDIEQDTVTVADETVHHDVPNVYASSVNPERFDPDKETVRLSFKLNTCADTTVRVYDNNDDLVKELRDKVNLCEGEHSLTWDGNDRANHKVDEGNYYFKINAENIYGNDSEKVSLKVDYDSWNHSNEKPDITRVDVDPERFDPYDESTEFSFKLNTCADVTIEVRDMDNDRVADIIKDRNLCEGSHDYRWDGEDNNGNKVRQDDYEFYIRAENNKGTDTARADVDVDYNGHNVNKTDRCAGYLDVSANDPYCEAIEYVKGSGIFDGYPDGFFRPYQSINRAETTKVIVRAFNYPELSADGTNLGFWDLSPSDWYVPYIKTAKQYGIIQGYEDGSFKPAQVVNRVELLKIFLKSASVALPTCNTASYPDVLSGAWYSDYVCYSKMHGLMDSDYYGNFNPAKPMTRGDVAELFYRFSKRNLGGSNYNNYHDSPKISDIRLSDYTLKEGDSFRVYYTLDEGADVTVTILDDDKDIVDTLVNDKYQSSGDYSIYFKGKDRYNDDLKRGDYFVRIEAGNRNGKYKIDTGFKVNNDSVNFRVSSLDLSDNKFNPDNKHVRISFRINDDADVSVKVYDNNNNLVARLWNNRNENAGNLSLTWDGEDEGNHQVLDGYYTIKVIADNGKDTDTDTVKVRVES